ncbi:hypothetical protein Ae201684P_003899 [Aphanomyces euteiches]|uniref:Helicase-associated domain-containing protein n=1 Tax=Aphanomyces euteiches TaxID=100861 RepID=A0A6G0XU56_9STRA|nr:hypothetical protein Ae201684_001616 [Aphanomyces euteiches]KAH9075216.1 hypothetical protein Ae201684P_003899 [Aphanomyces euteiches]KAH9137451.1 hypothetical protein AeRB84_017842 [Aphanomyces euteiches]
MLLWRHGVRAISTKSTMKNKAFTELVYALDDFHKKNGHFVVPVDYESTPLNPNDAPFPLGRKLQGLIRKLGQLAPTQQAELERIDFPVQWQAYFFRQIVLPALATYRRLHGHLRIPQSFVVPSGDTEWPQACWNLRLGNRVNHLRQHASDLLDEQDMEALEGLDFVWHAHSDRLHSLTIPALNAFHSLHGHAFVPQKFQVPRESTWSAALHGFQLGNAVIALHAAFKKDQLEPDVVAQLAALGLDLSQSRSHQKWHQCIFPALETFVRIFGHCDVAQAWAVPMNDPSWPVATWGLPLGRIVRDMRHIDAYAHVFDRDAVDALGFLWTPEAKLRFQVMERVIPALETFRQVYGHLFVSNAFVVPSHSPWPMLSQGFHLGGWIARRRVDLASLPHEIKFVLEETGIAWRHFDLRFDNVVLPAFELYAKLHGGTCEDMPTSFRVPHHPPWPEDLWGLNLGGAMWHIRNGTSYVTDPKKMRALLRCGVLA